MKVIVLGGGVIGTTSAWELSQAGFDVCLVEADASLAQATSYANGGQIAVGESGPWSTPDLLQKLWGQLGQDYPPFRLRLRADARQWLWLLRFVRNCAPKRYANALARNWRLASYSQKCLRDTKQKLGNQILYDAQTKGILQLFASEKSLRDARAHCAHLQEHTGAAFQVLSPAQCIKQEPALAHAFGEGLFVGGVLTPQDESGDAHLFTQGLGQALQGKVEIRLGERAQKLLVQNGKVAGVQTDKDTLSASAVVVAMGCASVPFLRRVGVRLPVLPLKGYSLTLPNVNGGAPYTSLTDYGQRLVISRLGDRLRVAGYAELGFDAGLDRKRVAGLRERLQSLFPQAGDYANVEAWCGNRPMSADGAPFIGRTKLNGLFVNTGHGSLGWTFSHGSARLLASAVAQTTPDIDPHPFAVVR